MLFYRFPILCVLFVVSLWAYYGSKKRLRTSADFLYRLMLGCLFVNLCFDMITFYTVNHLDTVSPLWNDLAHRIFIFSIDLFTFFFYLYTLSCIRYPLRRRRADRIFSFLPILLSLVMTLFGNLYYCEAPGTNYSYGPVASMIYLSIAFYFIATVLFYCKYRASLDAATRKGICLALAVEAGGGFIQALCPTSLISGGVQTLILLLLFLSFENPAEYLDKDSGVFNQDAFLRILSDCAFFRKPFYVAAVFCEEDALPRQLSMLGALAKQYPVPWLSDVYRVFGGCAAVLVRDGADACHALDGMAQRAGADAQCFHWYFTGRSVDGNAILREMEQMDARFKQQRRDVDLSTQVKNRNAYERALAALDAAPKPAGLWGLIIDVNHLKKTNDTYGHEYGDRLIRATASILSETFGSPEAVYRIGGDEFAVLLDHTSEQALHGLLQKLEHNRSTFVAPDDVRPEFSVGYALWDADADSCTADMLNRADRDMYAHKRLWHEQNP
ncbi:MAG: GGDEF domain-containing protein [Faecalibacterium sp.]|nr:GGDEF domain-containing protein [Faecalibacterium sp.]